MRVTTRWLGLACTIAWFAAGSQAVVTRRQNASIALTTMLSEHANLYFPGEANFDVATDRWSDFQAPNFTVVVEVAEEEDVAKAIRFANSEGLPFLAINGGHGTISTLSRMDHGLEIWMHKLNSFKIAEDGETATFGGGIQSGDVIQLLWAEGKQTVSGVCECTSYLGPGLGGGHGALQGRFGLLSDQFVSMHVAMADGEIHHISESEDSDLWWAMQGAGHNFGIVTSITSKIHDVPDNGLWGYELLYFTGDLVEKLADLFNELAEYQPPDFLIWTYILHNPELDGENPVIMANFIQRNVTNIECELIDSFRDLSPDAPLVAQAGLYTDIPRWIDTQRGGRGCARDSFKVRFPIGFPRYNRDALREFYDKFAEATSGSSPFNTSMVLLEQYSTQGVKAIPEDSTAFPHRQDDLLLSPVITWTSTDEETENEAIALGDTLREILHEKSGSEELHAYVNYAAGNEGPKNWYGYEPWRLEKLQELKRKYDPDAKFSYYAPVP